MSIKIASWNVNGIRAAAKSGFLNWFESAGADVVGLQEVKARPEQVEKNEIGDLIHPFGYYSYWHWAEKPGYSGVTLYSKTEPLSVIQGLDVSEIDLEGRVLTAEFSNFFVVNAYFPNSRRDHSRLPQKLRFCEAIEKHCRTLEARGKGVILCGDYNVAHQEIDLKNPATNRDNAGFLPEERAWMDRFLGNGAQSNAIGYVDAFRKFNPDPGHYTWWSYRPGVRQKNIGWRIDYFCVNAGFSDQVKRAWHQPEVRGSDHCPILLELKR